MGQRAECSSKPASAVKAYPKLKSKRPLYGTLDFDRNLSTGKATKIHFVLDESGEVPPHDQKNEEDKTDEKEPETSLLQRILEKLYGAAEESKPAEKPPEAEARLSRYDRLYLDVNCDLDLTNDPVRKPMKDPPWHALPSWKVQEKTAFEHVDLGVDYGPGLGVRPFWVLPWFYITEDGKYSAMCFVATVARQGRIRMGNHEYKVLLAQPHLITGRFDRPTTALFLKPVDPQDQLDSWGFGADMLMSMHRIDGELYSITATPLGDKLAVKPYRGEFGVFQIGPGDRDVKDISLQGSFRSKSISISVGPDYRKPQEEQKKISECELPVGDYVPWYLSIKYGRLQISLSENYHADGKPRDMDRRRTFGITIRKDRPFVLDFSNKPTILFASPAKDKTFKPGDEISVKAVLVDPVLDIMIRGLADTSRKKKETIRYGEGKDVQETTYERPLSLDPMVTITDSSGKTVAEGPMPFG